MEITSLKCNHCAADIEINPKIKFFNCNFCGSSLTIKNTGSAVYTEVIGEIKSNTDDILDNSNTILLEKELERVDREWLMEREPFMIQRNGNSIEPTSGSSTAITFGVIVFLIFGILFLFSITSSNIGGRHQPPIIPILLGILIPIVILISTATRNSNKYHAYAKAKDIYDEKRNDILSKIEESKMQKESE